jgi:hypothetical protein
MQIVVYTNKKSIDIAKNDQNKIQVKVQKPYRAMMQVRRSCVYTTL